MDNDTIERIERLATEVKAVAWSLLLPIKTRRYLKQIKAKILKDTGEKWNDTKVIERALLEYYTKYKLKKMVAGRKRRKRGL